MNNILHILIVIILTILTQVGGVLWVLNFGFYRLRRKSTRKYIKLLSFILLYIATTLLIVPQLAKLNSRVPLPVFGSNNLIPHNYITPILNRHYVKPELRSQLIEVSETINSGNNNLKISYLDANFPFIDGFPLLPHLSHNDGRKVDISFFYTRDGKEGILKPSNSGYGMFVEPSLNEFNQTVECKSNGYWQYDYTKYLTFGTRKDLTFDELNTRSLLNQIAQHPQTQKILLEPHLKSRLNLAHSKIRFQGCHAVRHDDHLHLQIVTK